MREALERNGTPVSFTTASVAICAQVLVATVKLYSFGLHPCLHSAAGVHPCLHSAAGGPPHQVQMESAEEFDRIDPQDSL